MWQCVAVCALEDEGLTEQVQKILKQAGQAGHLEVVLLTFTFFLFSERIYKKHNCTFFIIPRGLRFFAKAA